MFMETSLSPSVDRGGWDEDLRGLSTCTTVHMSVGGLGGVETRPGQEGWGNLGLSFLSSVHLDVM